METLCAFLNGTGGTILFGVTDKGKIIGQDLSDKTKRDIADTVNRLEPHATVQISYIPLPNSGKNIIAVHVEESRLERPFCYKGRPYMRIESVTSVMPQVLYNELLSLHDGVKYRWESIINESIIINDLDENAIIRAVRLGVDSGRLPEITIRGDLPAILEKFGLTDNGRIKNAAVVLFGKQSFNYPQCLLRLVRFKGTDKNEFLDNQQVRGNIFDLLDAAINFFFKHLSLSGKIEGLYREEELSIPVKALRECCINSFCHKSYSHPGSSVEIAIYDNRVEVENSGPFPQSMTIDKLKGQHHSVPTNPLIANVLYKSKVLESWGRGIGLMFSECQRVGLPGPEFYTDGICVWVIFRRSDQATDQVTDQVVSLVKVIGNRALSAQEIMVLLGLSHRPSFRAIYLHPALESGYIMQLYPEQPSSPKQKYYLTEKGKALVK